MKSFSIDNNLLIAAKNRMIKNSKIKKENFWKPIHQFFQFPMLFFAWTISNLERFNLITISNLGILKFERFTPELKISFQGMTTMGWDIKWNRIRIRWISTQKFGHLLKKFFKNPSFFYLCLHSLLGLRDKNSVAAILKFSFRATLFRTKKILDVLRQNLMKYRLHWLFGLTFIWTNVHLD